MSPENIPEHIRQFITQRVDSVEQLQVLLLLHSDPQKSWTVQSLAKELRSSNSSIEKRLNDLYNRKVLLPSETQIDEHRFRPYSGEMAKCIDSVTEYYRTHSYRLIELIFSKPLESLRSFAEAFRIKKDDKK